MQAVVQDRYGAPARLRLREMPRPEIGADEVLVRVRATSVHPDVWHVVTGRPAVLRLMGSGLLRPKNPVPGTDLAGVVEAAGAAVSGLRPGDEVFGESLRGFSWRNGGAYAEYAAVPQEALALKPANVTFEQAASVATAGYITLLNLPATPWQPGWNVLVNGAGGGVGGLALQLAKANGARVTAVEHTRKLDLVRALGADHVLDYTADDFTRGTERYDLIVDIPGNRSYAECRRVLAPTGRYVLIGHDHFGQAGRGVLGSLPRFAGLALKSRSDKRLRGAGPGKLTKQQAMQTLRAYLESGQLAPIIDRTFPLAEAGAAIDYLATGEPLGRVVLLP